MTGPGKEAAMKRMVMMVILGAIALAFGGEPGAGFR